MITWRMRVSCWIPMATSKRSEFVIIFLFHCNNGYTNAPSYITRTLSVLTFSNYQLNAQFLYSSTICMLQYDPQHISSSTLFILRRTNCITTASGIVTLCKQPYSMQVETDCSPLSTCILYGCLQRVTIPEAVWYNLSSWGWAACCSKHVEDRSVTYILLKNKGIVH